MKKFVVYTLLLALVFTQYACENNSLKAEKKEIREFLKAAGKWDNTIETSDGLFIYLTEEGTAGEEKPGPSSTVNVQYTGWLMENGAIFDSSAGNTVQFDLAAGTIISGMRLGLQEFRQGDRGELYIPSALAYGSISDRPGNAAYNVTIEAGSILVFDINMVSFF